MKTKQLAKKAKQLQTLETPEALWHIAKTTEYKATLLMQHPPYNVFTVPKRNGTQRLIEDPSDELKAIQKNISSYLQPLYYFYKTPAAYGYIIKPKDDDELRNIVTAAKKHSTNNYLLNIDIKDFFHYVSWQNIYRSLTAVPFSLHHSVAESICHLCTLNGRLPMGAPSSPALSNIVAFELDNEIQNYCNGEGIIYTRYVDDMSFSSDAEITGRHFTQLSGIVTGMGYPLREEKIKWFKPGEIKTITGLSVKDGKVSVPDAYIHETEDEIKNLKAYVLMEARLHPNKFSEQMFTVPVQRIKGAIAFIEAVHGSNFEKLERLDAQLQNALMPPQDYESLNWLEIGYTFF